jgi:hypothetical protein
VRERCVLGSNAERCAVLSSLASPGSLSGAFAAAKLSGSEASGGQLVVRIGEIFHQAAEQRTLDMGNI